MERIAVERQLGQERKYGGEGKDGEEGEETKHDAECGMRNAGKLFSSSIQADHQRHDTKVGRR